MWLLSSLAGFPSIDKDARRCPRCGYAGGTRHGWVVREVRDLLARRRVRLQRMYCPRCGGTWTVYPPGMAPYRQRSQRVRELGVLLYVLGLSYRKVSQVLGSLGVPVAASTLLGDVVAAGEWARAQNKAMRGRIRVRQVGIDGTGVPMAGEGSQGVVVAVDLESQQVLMVEAVEEGDTEAIREMIKEVVHRFGPWEVVTDEAGVYGRILAEQPAEEGVWPHHRLCAAHFRRNKARRLQQLRERAEKMGAPLLAMEAEALRKLLRSPPGVLGEVARRWYWGYYARVRAAEGEGWASWRYLMKQMLLELMEKGRRVTGITNNGTEGAIGRVIKGRMRSMRGMKKQQHLELFLNLASWVDRQSRLPLARLCF